jgi:hypothetical protein
MRSTPTETDSNMSSLITAVATTLATVLPALPPHVRHKDTAYVE